MAASIKSYRDLNVWVKSIDLVERCYLCTSNFPNHEIFGLANQINRASVSIPANIAEGHQRRHSKEFLQYLAIALGSLAELETHFEIAHRLKYVSGDEMVSLVGAMDEIGKMLRGLSKSVAKRLHRATNPPAPRL